MLPGVSPAPGSRHSSPGLHTTLERSKISQEPTGWGVASLCCPSWQETPDVAQILSKTVKALDLRGAHTLYSLDFLPKGCTSLRKSGRVVFCL
jgi:hypothetical protein